MSSLETRTYDAGNETLRDIWRKLLLAGVERFSVAVQSSPKRSDEWVSSYFPITFELHTGQRATAGSSRLWKEKLKFVDGRRFERLYGGRCRFGDGSYTPEIVVDGTRTLVGLDRAVGDAAIAAAQEAAAAGGPEVAVARIPNGLAVRVGRGVGGGRLLVVGFDREHRTAIGRGENTGRTVTETNAVRSVRDLGAWTGAPLALDAPAPAGEEAAVLLEATDGRILGAARTGG